MLTAIVENLMNQKKAYSHILALSKQEQSAIVASDAPLVGELAQQVWAELSAASRLEDDRVSLVKRFCAGAGKTGDCSLSELGELADPQTARALAAVGKELADELLAEQRRVNDLNRDLLELHFQYISFVIDTVAQSAPAGAAEQSLRRGRQGVRRAGPDAGHT